MPRIKYLRRPLRNPINTCVTPRGKPVTPFSFPSTGLAFTWLPRLNPLIKFFFVFCILRLKEKQREEMKSAGGGRRENSYTQT